MLSSSATKPGRFPLILISVCGVASVLRPSGRVSSDATMATSATVDDAKCDVETNGDEIANGDEDDDDDKALNSGSGNSITTPHYPELLREQARYIKV